MSKKSMIKKYCKDCNNILVHNNKTNYCKNCGLKEEFLKCEDCDSLYKTKKYNLYKIEKNKCSLCKTKETSLIKYGVDSPNKAEDVKEKTKKTCLILYGFDNPSKNKTIREKIKHTCLKKYGVTHPMKSKDKFQQEKIKHTCLKKYGVDNYSKTRDFILNSRKKYFYKNEKFDSSWELVFWIYCEDFNIPIKRNEKGFKYYINKKEKYFYPDFLINNNQLVEIKGIHLIKGSWKDVNDKTLEKLKICKKENIQIISDNDIKPYLSYVNLTYGRDYHKYFLTIPP